MKSVLKNFRDNYKSSWSALINTFLTNYDKLILLRDKRSEKYQTVQRIKLMEVMWSNTVHKRIEKDSEFNLDNHSKVIEALNSKVVGFYHRFIQIKKTAFEHFHEADIHDTIKQSVETFNNVVPKFEKEVKKKSGKYKQGDIKKLKSYLADKDFRSAFDYVK